MSPFRQYFRPLQPSIDYLNHQKVKYEEFAPHTELQDDVYCYWQLLTPRPLTQPFQYRIVSDGCIDILWEQHKPKDIYATGFSTLYVEYELGKDFHYWGIRFLPAGFTALSGLAAHTLVNQFIPLANLTQKWSDALAEMATSIQDIPSAQSLLNLFFLEQLPNKAEVDTRFLKAAEQILLSRGHLNLKELDVGIGSRQLRRLFAHYYGESPKTFAQILRFQNVLNAKPSMQSLKENKLFYDEGYYDQSHFIKEFKKFYGVTPNQAFGA